MKTSLLFIIMLLTSTVSAESGIVRKAMGDIFADGKKLSVNDKVSDGQTIEARGPKSMVVIKLETGGQIALKDGSMKMEASDKKDDSIITLTKGVFASHFINKGKGTQKVKAKYAVMGIRGTKYYVEAKEDSTYLCVCDGKVEINDGKKSELIGKFEDATAAPNKSMEKTKANQMMIDMALAMVKEFE